MYGKRAAEVSRLVQAARRVSPPTSAAGALARLAGEEWRRAAALDGCPGRQRVALLHAEEYARAAFLATQDRREGVSIPQD